LDFLSPESKLALAEVSNWQSEMRRNWSKNQQLREEKIRNWSKAQQQLDYLIRDFALDDVDKSLEVFVFWS